MPVPITLNGEPAQFPDGATVADLVERKALSNSVCAVEVNHVIVPRARRAQTLLKEGDTVEIVTLVGGG